jgi:hypothetical protein
MIEKLIKKRIQDCYENNNSFKKLLEKRFGNDYNDMTFIELNDFIMSNNDVYESNNLLDLIYDSFLTLNVSRFTKFLRNMVNEHPDRNRTYSHMINDIKENLDIKYQLPKEYYNMNKYQLNLECDKLFKESKFLQLSNTRQFINDNFRLNRYESFVFENRDLARRILTKSNLDETDRVYIRIRELLQKNPGYLGLFTYYNKSENIGFGRLKTLYLKLLKNANILNQLPRPVITYMPRSGVFHGPYKHTDGRTYNTHFEQLEDDITKLEEKHIAKLFADEYPGELKNGLQNNSDFVELVKEITNNPEKLEMYKKFWLNKVSRYKTQQELLDSLLSFVFADSGVKDIRNSVKNDSDLRMVYDDGQILVIRALSFDGIQDVASDTSWCIKDSLSYWVDYVYGDNVQLVIVDFTVPRTSLYRKIGVTLNSNGSVNTCHNINDGYMTGDEVNKILKDKINMTLYDLFDVAIYMGSNETYGSDEITSDSYRG